MIEGLRQMDTAELTLVTRLADQKLTEPRSNQELVDRIIVWMGKVVGCPERDPERIERAVIGWMAERWKLPFDAGTPTPEVERNLRVAIADEAGRHLLPFWQVGCAMARLGPEDAMEPKLALMEKVAARLMPSGSARAEMRQAWKQQVSPENDAAAVLESLRPHLDQLKTQPDMTRPTLVLSLVVALADGNLALYEENLYHAIASELKLSGSMATELRRHVNDIYWEKQRELTPRRTDEREDPSQAKLIALKAAHQTLEQTGILAELEDELQVGFLRQLHKDIMKDPAFAKGVESWNKTPLLWPLGYAAGLCLYFKNRLRADDHPGLVHIAYLAISRQHLMAARQAPELTVQDVVAPSPEPAAAVPAPKPEKPARRSIKLDPQE